MTYQEYDGKYEIQFKQWEVLKETVWSTKKKENISLKVTKKVEKTCTIVDAVSCFEKMLVSQMAHLGRIQHQRDQWKKLKGKMTKEDLLLLVDWSENYSCKYTEEVQSLHFSGSHQELSLHTGMVAKQGYDETFCTISDCKKHGPLAIFSHLKPILARHVTGETSRLHFYE